MKFAQNVSELIGHTPLVRLHRIEQHYGLNACLLAKVEGMNPAGSAKDRVAKSMIMAAQKSGQLKQGSVIIEPTSGNTGIGLVSVAACYGYRVILTMPDTMSVERIDLLKAYGAEVVLTEGSKGMAGAIKKANDLARQIPNSFIPGQFENPYNPKAHYETTGPEIWEDTDGLVDFFVAGVGTGGTITGTGQYLKQKNKNIRIIAVEPSDSAVLSGGQPGPHQLQGIGAGFIPDILDVSVYDEIVAVDHKDAFEVGRQVARLEGILVGITSGAALHAAIQIAKREENCKKKFVVLLPDRGERYLSTPMFRDIE